MPADVIIRPEHEGDFAAIGAIIERHMAGAIVEPGSTDRVRPQPERLAGQPCPQCGAAALIRVEGCNNCLDCGYSKCG